MTTQPTPTYEVVTIRSAHAVDTEAEAWATYAGLASDAPVALIRYDTPDDEPTVLAESQPDICVWCGTYRSFCLCRPLGDRASDHAAQG